MLSALKPSLFVEEIDPRLKRAIGATKGINVSFRNTPSDYIKTLTFYSPQGDFCEPRVIKQTSDTGIIRCPCPITGEMILGWLASELKAVCRKNPTG